MDERIFPHVVAEISVRVSRNAAGTLIISERAENANSSGGKCELRGFGGGAGALGSEDGQGKIFDVECPGMHLEHCQPVGLALTFLTQRHCS